MPRPSVSIDFEEWFLGLNDPEIVVVRALLDDVAADGFYRAGCTDQGDGVWLLTDRVNGLYLRLYLTEEPKGTLTALYGSISDHQAADAAEVKMARLVRDGVRSSDR